MKKIINKIATFIILLAVSSATHSMELVSISKKRPVEVAVGLIENHASKK